MPVHGYTQLSTPVTMETTSTSSWLPRAARGALTDTQFGSHVVYGLINCPFSGIQWHSMHKVQIGHAQNSTHTHTHH